MNTLGILNNMNKQPMCSDEEMNFCLNTPPDEQFLNHTVWKYSDEFLIACTKIKDNLFFFKYHKSELKNNGTNKRH